MLVIKGSLKSGMLVTVMFSMRLIQDVSWGIGMKVYDIDYIQAELACVCGLQKTWLKVGETSSPCPMCGARIRAYYDDILFTIKAEEIK